MNDSAGSPKTTITRHEPLADGTYRHGVADHTSTPVTNHILSPHPASLTTPVTPLRFQTTTIAPSPPLTSDSEKHLSATLQTSPPVEMEKQLSPPVLRMSTNVAPVNIVTPKRSSSRGQQSSSGSRNSSSLEHKPSLNSMFLSRTPSLKAALSHNYHHFGSASGTDSLVPSPVISAMGDMTPLPSPLMLADSPGPWKKLSGTPPKSRDSLGRVGENSVLVTSTGESVDSALLNASKRKLYASLESGEQGSAIHSNPQMRGHSRNRSNSDYIPDATAVPRRNITVSGPRDKPHPMETQEPHIKRELNYAESRGLTPTVTQPPTPPPSESSKDSTDVSTKTKDQTMEFYQAKGRHDQKRRRWRLLRYLGQGTFSRVVLATSQAVPSEEEAGDPKPETHVSRKSLVAVKICEHGPRGGASENRVEMSLKRELDLMQSIHHPSLVDLKAWSIEPTRAILILTYCIGGDLFDVATGHRELLSAPLLKRMFSELIGAVRYLHERRIVHRDIKLENVLVNLTPKELADTSIDWATYPNSVTTLTDLGLSRRVADDEKLETRCGSDDYAAPEVIMGQSYDGRAVDAWSLGVLLYALLEARLPFDPHPGMSDAHRMRSRTSHRIARVEWRWVEYGGDDGDHEGNEAKFQEKGLFGAMQITEGLLKRARSRWSVEKVSETEWVKEGILVEGGVKFWEEEAGEEVS